MSYARPGFVVGWFAPVRPEARIAVLRWSSTCSR